MMYEPSFESLANDKGTGKTRQESGLPIPPFRQQKRPATGPPPAEIKHAMVASQFAGTRYELQPQRNDGHS
jgi:hypothetical protein